MDAFEENFVATFPKDAKRTRSVVIQQELGERIMGLLKNPLRKALLRSEIKLSPSC